ncbi:MAG: hypothetical protein K5928_06965 [Prevotella sp.]|nr:hypothetical protein [Prevotella sp.]
MNRQSICTLLLTMAATLLLQLPAEAEKKPRWVGNTPQATNATYRFIEVVTYGTTAAEAAGKAMQQLATDQALRQAVSVNVQTGMLTTTRQQLTGGRLDETEHTTLDVKVSVSGKDIHLQARQVDQWNAGLHSGSVEMHTLYQVAVTDRPRFDRTQLTTAYGAAPVAMSIVPGLGQWYKGSRVKGALLFGGVAACGVGALLFENQRKSNMDKVAQNGGNLQLIKHYSDQANSNKTLRNVCLGAGAAIWLYNIIDAATAQGARRVLVGTDRGGTLSLQPTMMPGGQPGLQLAWGF